MTHSRPSFSHSYHRPTINIIRNMVKGATLAAPFDAVAKKGVAIRRAISRSNIRNKMATMKKRNEKGRRADFIGSKPHSYGEVFFRSGIKVGSKRPKEANTIVNPKIAII